MSDPLQARIQARLEGGALDSLATLAVDDLLGRPVRSVVNPEQLARLVVIALETTSTNPRTEAWVQQRLAQLDPEGAKGTLGDYFPAEVAEPLRRVMTRPYQPNHALVSRLMDHPAMQRLVRDILVGALTQFTARLRPRTPQTPSMGRLKALGRGVRSNVLGNLGEEVLGGLEQRAEQKIRDFVDQALTASIAQIVDHLCAPEHADDYGQLRGHFVGTLLETENQILLAELAKLQPDQLVDTFTATARSLAHREGLQDDLAHAIQRVLDDAGELSLSQVLDQAGVDTHGPLRHELQAQILERARDLVRTDAFAVWLQDLIRPE